MEKKLFTTNGLFIRRFYVYSTFTDTITKLTNTNHVTKRNWKYHVVRRLEWYEYNRPGVKNNNV